MAACFNSSFPQINSLDESGIKHLADHFLIGDAVCLVSLFNRRGEPRAGAEDEFCGDIAFGERLLGSYADSLHFGLDKTSGRWSVNSGGDGCAGAEKFCLICCAPHELDRLDDLMSAFCGRYGQKGYMLAYNRRAFYIDEHRNKFCLGECALSLEQLARMYAALCEKNLPEAENGGNLPQRGLFIIENLERCCLHRSGCSSFMGYVGYKNAVQNLERCGDKLFDKMEEWNHPKS